MARRLNDFSADLSAGHSGRLGWFATVPMPDAAASAAEGIPPFAADFLLDTRR
ncbi:hypothetical protein [Streptomyces arenae]|uniref:hypothetical protein n=1 Tax=Streptomyces arenae TaxID=29301 RepID=UPI00265A7659|nr:hypothetical protein [Streptomyces arenae]MCG7204759.1 hypothetical protein [Streptomyces arenae]